MDEGGIIKHKKDTLPVESKYNTIFGLPNNKCEVGFEGEYSELIYAQLGKMEKLHKGGFYSRDGVYVFDMTAENQSAKTFVLKETLTHADVLAQKLLVVVKIIRGKDREKGVVSDLKEKQMESVLHDIKVINLLRKANIPTLEQAFIYKGRYLITSIAHSENEFIAASNSKLGGMSSKIDLPLISIDGNKQFVNKYKQSLIINNFEEVLEDIFKRLVLDSSEHWLQVGFDSLFFRIPLETNSQKKVDIKWLVGDIGNVAHIPYLKPNLKNSFVGDLEKFVKYFARKDLQEEYLARIDKCVRKTTNKYNQSHFRRIVT